MKSATLFLLASLSLFACKGEPAQSEQSLAAPVTEAPAAETTAEGTTEPTADDGSAVAEAPQGIATPPAAANSAAAIAVAPTALGATAIRTDGVLPVDFLALIPDDAAVLGAFDLDAAVRHYSAIAGVDPAEQRAEWARQLAPLLAGEEVPEVLRGNVRLENIRTLAFAVWDDESGVIITDSAALANGPADGEQIVVEDATIARRGERLLIGSGSRFEAMLSDEGFKGFDLSTAWPEGAASVPDGASFIVAVPAFSTLDDVPEELATVRQIVFATGLGTESVLVFDSNIDSELRGYLGRAQREAATALSQLRMLAPPFLQAWVGYVELVVNSLWAQVQLETEGSVTRIGIAAPQCGAIGSIHLAALLAGAVAVGAVELDGPLTPFEPVEQRIADTCAPMPGPAPNLPRHFAAMAGNAIDGDRLVAMMDLGAILRTNLPTLFQLLPYSLHHEDLNEVMGATPLGLAGLGDANGHLGGYVVDPDGEPEEAVLVLPEGTFGYLPIPTPSGFNHELIEGVGSIYSLPGSEALIRQELDADSPWGRLMGALPADSVVAVAATGDLFRDLLTELPEIPAIGRETRLAALSIGSDLSFGAYFFVAENSAAIAEATESEIVEGWTASMEGATEDERMMGDLFFGQFRKSIVVEAVGADIVAVRFELPGGHSGGVLGLGSAVMIPAMISYIDAAEGAPFGVGIAGIEPPKLGDPTDKP